MIRAERLLSCMGVVSLEFLGCSERCVTLWTVKSLLSAVSCCMILQAPRHGESLVTLWTVTSLISAMRILMCLLVYV